MQNTSPTTHDEDPPWGSYALFLAAAPVLLMVLYESLRALAHSTGTQLPPSATFAFGEALGSLAYGCALSAFCTAIAILTVQRRAHGVSALAALAMGALVVSAGWNLGADLRSALG